MSERRIAMFSFEIRSLDKITTKLVKLFAGDLIAVAAFGSKIRGDSSEVVMEILTI